ncbi:MAG: efflux RND transporter periplasmic adaptor subunit [Alphaproteobacteria bacterium]
MKRMLVICAALLLAGCEEKKDEGWLGYGEGDSAMVSAPQAGWVTALNVERGAQVKQGDVLFVLDSTQQEASREQATATLEEARAQLKQEDANLTYQRTELARQDNLARFQAGVPAQRDLARNNARQSAARIAQLKAQIGQMEANLKGAAYGLSQRRITSQTQGPVQDIYFRPGEYVPASTPVLSVLPPANIYARFFVPETQLPNVRLGQKVRIACDGCQPMTATITFIAAQAEFTPPVIFSVGNREKLVFKLEARSPGGLKLHPGQPLTVQPL